MASRRHELNAYTFSRRRTVAAFLRPSSGGDDEEAPKAVRAFMPSLVVGAVAVAAFGAYGILKPSAPKNWEAANAIIVGKPSTARYVVLKDTAGRPVLHPVLNLASAKLLLNQNSTVEEIDDSVLDSSAVLHGAPVGIQYAPDWLPSEKQAGTAKLWAACDEGGTAAKSPVRQSLLVLGATDRPRLTPSQELRPGEAVLVETPDSAQYLVDSTGTYHRLVQPPSAKHSSLAYEIFATSYYLPEHVDRSWLQTLAEGRPIDYPSTDLKGFGTTAGYALDGRRFTVGTVVQVSSAGSSTKYVVTQDRLEHVTDFTAALLSTGRSSSVPPSISVDAAQQHGGADPAYFEGGLGWPQEPLKEVNAVSHQHRTVVCGTYTTGADGTPRLGVWAGRTDPFSDSTASSSVYTTPGTGVLYRETLGPAAGSGKIYLLTQNGMKYPVQVNTDAAGSGAAGAPAATASPTASAGPQADSNLVRLGYGKVVPVPVPASFSSLLPTGPTLDTADAESTQHF